VEVELHVEQDVVDRGGSGDALNEEKRQRRPSVLHNENKAKARNEYNSNYRQTKAARSQYGSSSSIKRTKFTPYRP
jgi:uncharacterized protein (DUF1330 family)